MRAPSSHRRAPATLRAHATHTRAAAHARAMAAPLPITIAARPPSPLSLPHPAARSRARTIRWLAPARAHCARALTRSTPLCSASHHAPPACRAHACCSRTPRSRARAPALGALLARARTPPPLHPPLLRPCHPHTRVCFASSAHCPCASRIRHAKRVSRAHATHHTPVAAHVHTHPLASPATRACATLPPPRLIDPLYQCVAPLARRAASTESAPTPRPAFIAAHALAMRVLVRPSTALARVPLSSFAASPLRVSHTAAAAPRVPRRTIAAFAQPLPHPAVCSCLPVVRDHLRV
jgi:hypothetical protein